MKPLRCACYARFSSDRQNPLSIDDQLRKCREYASRQNWQFLTEYIYSDEAISGATDDRAGLRSLIEAATSIPKPFEVVLIDDTSRLSRKLVDSLRITEELRFAGVRLIFVSQGIDSDSEQAEVLLATHGIVDSVFIRELAKKVHRGMEGRALQRLHCGGRCFGYRNQPIEDPIKRDSYGRPEIVGVRLVVDEAEAGIVRRIFDLYAGGYSLKRIAILLNDERVSSPRPQTGRLSRSWCQSSVRKILSNDRYRGVVFWGKTRKVRSPKTGKRIKRDRDPTEWVMREIPEQRIVSDELWDRVEQRREQVKIFYGNRGRKPGLLRGRAASSPYLFSGILKCGVCGASMTIVSGRADRNRTSYGCSFHAQRGGSICDNSLRIRKDIIENRLLAKLQAEVLKPEAVEYTLDRFERELLQTLDNLGGELKQMHQRKAKLEAKIQELTRALEDGYSPALTTQLADREKEIAAITDRLLASQPNSVRSKLKDLRGFVISRLFDLRGLLNSDVMKAKTQLSHHVKAIYLHPDPAKRTYTVSGTLDLLGVANWSMPGDRNAPFAHRLPGPKCRTPCSSRPRDGRQSPAHAWRVRFEPSSHLSLTDRVCWTNGKARSCEYPGGGTAPSRAVLKAAGR